MERFIRNPNSELTDMAYIIFQTYVEVLAWIN